MSGPSNFRFIDDTDAQRQLGVDRLTFQELLRSKRLRPVSSQGTIQFFRAGDLVKLRAELNPETEAEDAAERAQDATPSAEDKKPVKKHDPAMRVHLRLQADLKWYDISDTDLQAWFDQVHPDTYERRRILAQFLQTRMTQIMALIDDGIAHRALMPADGQPQNTGEDLRDDIHHETKHETAQKIDPEDGPSAKSTAH